MKDPLQIQNQPGLIFGTVSEPNNDDLESLRKSLKAFNDSITGEYEEKEIAAFVKNSQGMLLVGFMGN